MLIKPEEKTIVFKIIGIDPGTMFCGVSIMDIEYPTFKILNIEVSTIAPDEEFRYIPEIDNPYPIPTNRLFYLHDRLVTIYTKVNPRIIGIESPFFNRLRPGAYGPLSEAMQAIKRSIFDYNSELPFHLFPPSIVKKDVGASWKASKDEMTAAVSNLEELPKSFKDNLYVLNEHEIDATSVAYSLFKMLKENEVLVCFI
jgi:Holliday junction resolvasome RuvABC endonuclease subunit